MADFDAQLPVRAIATQFTTEVANSAGTTIDPATTLAQASTTSGQTGTLAQGATTTAAPTYTTATTNPLSLTTAGALRTDASATTQPVSGTVTANQGTSPWVNNITQVGGSSVTLGQKTSANSIPVVIASDQSAIPVSFTNSTVEKTDYKTVSALASNATDTHNYTPAGTDLFDGFEASASGAIKVELKIGTTGAETSRGVWFSSSSSRYISVRLPNPISVPNTNSVKLLVTNFDKQAMDVYSTILTH